MFGPAEELYNYYMGGKGKRKLNRLLCMALFTQCSRSFVR